MIFKWLKERRQRQRAIQLVQQSDAELERIRRELAALAALAVQMAAENKQGDRS